jgi:secreted trypsin-like serine protease
MLRCLLLSLVAANSSSDPLVTVMTHENDDFVKKMKDRVILFPEENLKLSFINQQNDDVGGTDDYPRLKDTNNTSRLSYSRRQRRADKRSNVRGRNGRPKGAGRYRNRSYSRPYNPSAYSSLYNNNRQQTSTWMRAGWTSWGRWSPCSQTCGAGGVQTRRRFCANGSYGGETCAGKSIETQNCFVKQCVTYSWSTWAAWTECSKTCGGGMRYRARACYALTAQRKQVSNDKCGKDLFWAYDNCNTQSCTVAKGRIIPGQDHEHSYGAVPLKCGMKQNPFARSSFSVQQNKKLDVQLRIAGGVNARHGDWPWQVSFQHRTCRKVSRNTRSCTWKHLCGASIVDNKWVITAAHCIVESGFFFDAEAPGDDWSVVVGMDKLQNEQLGKQNEGTRIYLDKIKVHPTYKFNYITHADIALLKLAETLEYNEYIQPICMPDGKEPAHGDMCHITGWGFTSGTGDELSYHLKEAQIPVVDFGECRNVEVWYRLLNSEVHMCAGDRARGGVDSCGGDSGGPLSCQRPDGSFFLAGVTSFGFSDCGKKGHVGIYARMTTFEQWAIDTIAADESKSDYSPYYEDFHNIDNYRSQGGPK